MRKDTIKPRNTLNIVKKKVTDAYFAIIKTEEVKSSKTHAYTFGGTNNTKGDKNKQKIAKIIFNKLNPELLKKNQATTKGSIASALTKDSYKKGDIVNITLIEEKVTFEKLKKGILGQDIHVIVKTEELKGETIKINVNQGKEKKLTDKDKAIKIQFNDKELVQPETIVGGYKFNKNINNKEDYKDWAIFKIKIGPKTEATFNTYNNTLSKATDIKTHLFLSVDGGTSTIYTDTSGKAKTGKSPNQWFNKEREWFELKKWCNCGEKYDKKFQCTRYGSVYGPVYWGKTKLASYKSWADLIKQNKVTQDEKDILIGMSENEGKLDSVQSYDSEILTVGAMQKTVNPKGEGEFTIQVKEFKTSNPDKYKTLFEECGWTIDSGKMYYKDPNDDTAKKVTGADLKTLIRKGFTKAQFKKKLKCKPLVSIVFAANDKDFQAKQVEDFIDRLRNKVLPIKPKGYTYTLKDYLKSKLGKATALDHHINRPGYVKTDFGKALDNFFIAKDKEVTDFNKTVKVEKDKKKKIERDPSKWGIDHGAYEKSILDDYGKNRRGTDMPNRYSKMKAKL
ncbi:hypothetical protein [uncultured Algibacter sp.]|uniref:hypothetical protein n=1 Tax=uncultured Algibacter sp. TaxID=298659 RepID=UPI0032166C11